MCMSLFWDVHENYGWYGLSIDQCQWHVLLTIWIWYLSIYLYDMVARERLPNWNEIVKEIHVNDIVSLTYFVGIELPCGSNMIILFAIKYELDLLIETCIHRCNLVPTPIYILSESHTHTHTHNPNIAFIVRLRNRYMPNSKEGIKADHYIYSS